MKMKRVTIQIVMDYPANHDPFKYISISGGQLTRVSEKKIIAETDLGEVDPPWGQKRREFYAVRKIVQDGVRAGVDGEHVVVTVYGSHYADCSYWFDINTKEAATLSYKHNAKRDSRYEPIRGMRVTLSQGILTWSKASGGWGEHKKVATMSVGNPNIVDEIAEFIRKRLK